MERLSRQILGNTDLLLRTDNFTENSRWVPLISDMESLPRAISMAQVNRLDVYNRQIPQVLCSLHVNNCQMSLTSQSALTLNILEQSYSY